MAANNETGVLQPWREIGALCRARGVPFHCDAAQWIGKMPAADLGGACDFLTGCAHKFGGPKGTGFLLAPSRGAENFRAAAGGPQENRMRAGTEDLPGILALLAALDDKDDADLAAAAEGRTADRAGFERAVLQALPGAKLVAPDAERLWNTVMLVMPPAHSNLKWLTRLSRLGFAVSTGSACSAGQGNPSHTMAAMGLAPEEMSRVLRVSGGWGTTAADWLALAAALAEVAAELDSGARLDSAAIPGTS
ncbi:MAG: aminotransferase class V-fold PLP-dependent enzyme, partial [Verrucomicrobiae bacterium]|nr:aminotransferase class V-fold PLP-dependent enzyme [Verrucomicrobiae bacterium]